MYGCIYIITNVLNNKHYIGQTKRDIHTRLQEHFKCCHNIELRNDIEKFGINSFTTSILDYAETSEELDAKEKYWISKYDSYSSGYNKSSGGNGPLGTKWTSESKDKVSLQRKGSVWVHKGTERHLIQPAQLKDFDLAEYTLGYGPGRIRVPQTEETRIKISAKQKGRPKPIESVKKMADSLRAAERHWYTNGTDNKILSSNEVIPEGYYLGRTIVLTEEEKLKRYASQKGKPSWNKGLTKETDERVRQYSEKLKRNI